MKVPIGNDGKTHYMDRRVIRILEAAKKRTTKQEGDIVFVVDGRVGVGKSTFAAQCANYCDFNMTLDNFAFTLEQWKKKTLKREKCSIQYDEAFAGGMDSRSAMSKINKAARKILSQIRYKHLYTFICMPCFFELDRYIVWRANGVFHVIKLPNGRRKWYYWDYKKLIKLYFHGKKSYYSYKGVSPTLSGTFSKFFPFNFKRYETRKRKAIESG
jgi:hypothetical protein